jgi:hypothetical protein
MVYKKFIKNKKEYENPSHIIKIRVRDKSKEAYINEKGVEIIPTKWVVVNKVDLGSVKEPNKEIFEVSIEPIWWETDRTRKLRPFENIFKDLGDFFKEE